MHGSPHPLAGQTVLLGPSTLDPIRGIVRPGAVFRVEDWVDRLWGTDNWFVQTEPGNWAIFHYQQRIGHNQNLVLTNQEAQEAVYGKINGLGHIVLVRELGDVLNVVQHS